MKLRSFLKFALTATAFAFAAGVSAQPAYKAEYKLSLIHI